MALGANMGECEHPGWLGISVRRIRLFFSSEALTHVRYIHLTWH